VRVTVGSNDPEVKRPDGVGYSAAMRGRRVVVALLALALTGCAGVACAPATIVVAKKDDRSQLRSEPRGIRTDAQGRVSEVRREVIVTEYWVQDHEGRWYRLGEAAWRAVEPGQPVEVCR
jgi:hypothetical protein